MKNMFSMIKDAATMQRTVKGLQSQMRKKTAQYAVADGGVIAVARADGTMESIQIEARVMDPARPAALEKLVLKAVQGALEAARKAGAEDMKAAMGRMGLPNVPGLMD